MLRLFETGRLEEERLIRNLRRIGVTVLDVDPETGRQWHVQAHGGHFGGSLDGVALGIPEAPKTWHVLEFKTHNAKSLSPSSGAKGVAQGEARALGADAGLHASDRAHPGALPRGLQGHRRALRRAGAGRPRRGRAADRAAGRIIFAPRPPARISDDPDWFECRLCPHHDTCHGDRLPRAHLPQLPACDADRGRAWHCARFDQAALGRRAAGRLRARTSSSPT